jgi:membrane associated rhomboid family serine protease
MTITIVIITSLISIVCFSRPDFVAQLQFNPYKVFHRKEWHRLVTHGFLHANWFHLIINMFVLFTFGTAVEKYFKQLNHAGILRYPNLDFLLLYFGGIIISSITTLNKYRHNPSYNAIGASGAVSAIVFTSIFFNPLNMLILYFIPLPAILAGILYLIYSHYMSKRGGDNINHDAHFLGAVFGFIFPLLIDYKLINIFFQQLNIF